MGVSRRLCECRVALSGTYPDEVVIQQVEGVAELSDNGGELEDGVSDGDSLDCCLEVLHGLAESHDCLQTAGVKRVSRQSGQGEGEWATLTFPRGAQRRLESAHLSDELLAKALLGIVPCEEAGEVLDASVDLKSGGRPSHQSDAALRCLWVWWSVRTLSLPTACRSGCSSSALCALSVPL